MKNVLITGASGGIGAAIARAFAQAGYGLALHYHRGETAARALAAELSEKYAVPALALGADLRSSAETAAMIAHAQEELGFIGTLVKTRVSPTKNCLPTSPTRIGMI